MNLKRDGLKQALNSQVKPCEGSLPVRIVVSASYGGNICGKCTVERGAW